MVIFSDNIYLSKPILTHTIPGQVFRPEPVQGLAVLHDELYLLRRNNLTVYDAPTLTLQRHLAVDGLVSPYDMASSGVHDCLYMADAAEYDDAANSSDAYIVHRVEPRGGRTTRWPVKSEPSGLSVTPVGGSVVVTFYKTHSVDEYTTHGQLIRTISLSNDKLGIVHAVRLSNNQFAVLFRYNKSDDVGGGNGESRPNRVCVVDVDGNLVHSYGDVIGSTDGQMDRGGRLAVDKSGFVLYADSNLSQVLLLSRTLIRVRELVSERNIEAPYWGLDRMCFDEKRGQLYLADFTHPDLLSFKVVE